MIFQACRSTKERIVESKGARTGSLAIVDKPQVTRTCILRVFLPMPFFLSMFCFVSFRLRSGFNSIRRKCEKSSSFGSIPPIDHCLLSGLMLGTVASCLGGPGFNPCCCNFPVLQVDTTSVHLELNKI